MSAECIDRTLDSGISTTRKYRDILYTYKKNKVSDPELTAGATIMLDSVMKNGINTVNDNAKILASTYINEYSINSKVGKRKAAPIDIKIDSIENGNIVTTVTLAYTMPDGSVRLRDARYKMSHGDKSPEPISNNNGTLVKNNAAKEITHMLYSYGPMSLRDSIKVNTVEELNKIVSTNGINKAANEKRKIQGVNVNAYGSDEVKDSNIDKEYINIENDILKDVNTAKRVLNRLIEMDKTSINDKHKHMLTSIIEHFVDIGSPAMSKMKLFIDKRAAKNGGFIRMKSGKETGIYISVGKEPSSLRNSKTLAEIYAHEIMHAVADYTGKLNNAKVANAIKNINRIKDHVLMSITPKDLLVNVSNPTKAEIKEAEDLIEYMKTKNGTHEFIALSMTNEHFANYLESMSTKNMNKIDVVNKEGKPENWLQAITQWTMKLMEFVFSRYRIPNDSNARAATYSFLTEIAHANNNTVKKGILNSIKVSMTGFNKTSKDIFIDIVEKIIPKNEFELKSPSLSANSPFVSKAYAALMDHIGLAHIAKNNNSEEARNYIEGITSYIGSISSFKLGDPAIGARSTFHDTLNNILFDKDATGRTFEDMIIMSKKQDRIREHTAAGIQKTLLAAFKNTISRRDSEIISRVGIYTDLYTLVDKDNTIIDLEKIVRKDTELDKAINKELENFDKLSNEERNTIVNKSKILAYAMITNSNSLIDRNAEQIGIRHKNLVKNIDKLITLYAIKYSNKGERKEFANLIKKEANGIEAVLRANDVVKQKKREMYVSDDTKIPYYKKGKIKNETDSRKHTLIATLDQKSKIEKNGYKLIKTVEKYGIKFGIYHADGVVQQNWVRKAMRLTSKNTVDGNSLNTILYNSKIDPKIARQNHRKIVAMAQREKLAFDKKLKESIISDNIIKNISQKDISINAMYDQKSNIYDLVIDTNIDHKRVYNGLDENAIYSVSRSIVDLEDEKKSAEFNEGLTDAIYEDIKAKQPIITVGERNENGYVKYTVKNEKVKKWVFENPYIVIAKDSDDIEIRDAWNKMPREMIEYIKKKNKEFDIQNLPEDAVVIRADALYSIFGYRDPSIIDLVRKKSKEQNLPGKFKSLVLKFESLIKEIAGLIKIDIVIKTPKVLIDNIVSNSLFLMQQGFDPVRVLIEQARSVVDVHNYLTMEKQLYELNAKIEIGTATNEEKNRYKLLSQRIADNPAHALMEKGAYSGIVEDLNTGDALMDTANSSYYYTNKLTEKIPGFIKDGIDFLWVGQKSNIFKLLTNIMQSSDFVARLAYTNLEKTRQINKNGSANMDEIWSNAKDLFISYDNPLSKFLTYTNALFLTPFVTYAINIFRPMRKSFFSRPLQFIGIEAIASFLGMASVGEYMFLFGKHSFFENNIRNPFDELSTLMNPSLLEMFGLW